MAVTRGTDGLVRLKVDNSQIRNFTRYANEAMVKAVQKELGKIGQEIQTKVRHKPEDESWKNRTHNLRASIGFAVYSRGMIVRGGRFYTHEGEGQKGVEIGKDRLAHEAPKHTAAASLLVVAAMPYARYVEARPNKDVLGQVNLEYNEDYVKDRLKIARAEFRAEMKKKKL